jgi:hypothetical protein
MSLLYRVFRFLEVMQRPNIQLCYTNDMHRSTLTQLEYPDGGGNIIAGRVQNFCSGCHAPLLMRDFFALMTGGSGEIRTTNRVQQNEMIMLFNGSIVMMYIYYELHKSVNLIAMISLLFAILSFLILRVLRGSM